LPATGSNDDIDKTTDAVERQIAKMQADAEAAGQGARSLEELRVEARCMRRPSGPGKPTLSNTPISSRTSPIAPAWRPSNSPRPRSRPTSSSVATPRSCPTMTSRSRAS
jgi:hypothetical protein